MNGRNLRELLKLLPAYGTAQCAGHLLTTVFAKTVYDQRASVVLASAVLGLNYLPPALLTSVIGPWIDRHCNCRTLVGIEAGALALTLLCVLVAAAGLGLPLLFALLSLRAVLMATARSGYARWLKHTSPPETQAQRMKLFTLTFMSATTLAGLFAWAVMLGPPSGLFFRLAAMAVLLHLTALAVIGLLRPLPEIGRSAHGGTDPFVSISASLHSIWESRSLRESFLIVVFSQATFQAAYLGLIVLLPAIEEMGPGGAGLCQVGGNVGLLIGFAIAFAWPKLVWLGTGSRRGRCLATTAVGAVALFVAVTTPAPVALAGLATMTLAYEVVFIPHQAAFFATSPPEKIGQYQNLLSSVGGLFMALTCLLFAALCEAAGPACGALSFLTLLGATATGVMLSRRPPAPVAPDVAPTQSDPVVTAR